MKRRRKNKKNKKLIIILSIILLVMVILVISFFVYKKIEEKNRLKVVLSDELSIEVNSQVYMNSFIDEIYNGKIVSEDEIIDTSKIGDKEIILSIETKKEVVDYKFDVSIVDTVKPEITAKEEITVYVNKEVDLLKDVLVTDNSKEELDVKVEGEYDFKKEGEYKLKYVAIDSSSNKEEVDFVLKVISDPNNRTFTTSKGFSGKVINGVTYIDGVLIANKTYSLPSSYGKGLTSETTSNFNKMKADASSLGLNIYISSGYRSYYDQKYIYNNYVKNDGQKNADTYSARAGHSEHQSGLAFDLNSISNEFGYTDEGKWVNENCYLYGFIIRYPEGKSSITGYIYEPWHLRYVGVELATKLYNNGDWITLEEYFGIDSKYS